MDEMRAISIDQIKPYKFNPRDNKKTISELAESIKEFGFLQPIVVDKNFEVIVGHTRLEAAKSIGMETVPVIFADKLTDAQVMAYRIADNKIGEKSKWDKNLLEKELEKINASDFDFSINLNAMGINFDNIQKRQAWKQIERLCDLKQNVQCFDRSHNYCTTFFRTGASGKSIEEIKEDENNVELFARVLVDYIENTIGVVSGWCIMTTPRRRHKDGFHFATEVCRMGAAALKIPFYESAIECKNRHRIDPEFELVSKPGEKCVILYDDIITTGATMKAARNVLTKKWLFRCGGCRNKKQEVSKYGKAQMGSMD